MLEPPLLLHSSSSLRCSLSLSPPATLNSYPLSPAMARLGFLSLALLSLQAFIGGGLAEVCFGHLVRSHAN